ncbi:MAG: cation transporter [Bacteriovoracaceae bacterium]|nr:cation transporter [Bacteriovoracaceae bacterium]
MHCENKNRDKCVRCREHAGTAQLGGTIFLTVLKIVVGILGNSKGLLADAIHSAANIVTSAAIFISKKWGDKPADKEHPFGHGKLEFVTSSMVSGLLVVSTLYIIWHSLDEILHGHPGEMPHWTVVVVAIISIIVNEALFQYLQCVGNEFKSSSILTNSWAIRSDSFSSIAVIAGVIATRLGFTHSDGYVALAVASIIVYVCFKLFLDSIMHLMDKSIPLDQLNDIRATINDVVGDRLQSLSARLNGRKIWVNATLSLGTNSKINVLTDYDEKIQEGVRKNHKQVDKVLVDFKL